MRGCVNILLAVLVLGACIPRPAQAETLRLLTGFPKTYLFNKEITNVFIDEVKKSSNGKIKITVLGPEAVPTFEQLDPVAQGVFDLLLTHPGYHVGSTALGLSLDAIAPNPEKRRSSGVWDFYDHHYQNHGVKLIAIPAMGSKGFQVFSRKSLSQTPGKPLDGLKIRAVQTYFPMVKSFGGAPVVLPGNEIYTSLERGVIDGAVWAVTGIKDFKWNEVAKHLVRPLFGQASLQIFASAKTWGKLDQQTREILLEAGRKVEMQTPGRFDELQAQEEKFLLSNGMDIVKLPDEIANNIDVSFANGVWGLVEEKAGADAEKLHGIARDAGLTP